MFLIVKFKTIILLIFITFIAFFSFSFGFLDTSMSLIEDNNDSSFQPIFSGDVSGGIVIDSDSPSMECHLETLGAFNLCGLAIDMGRRLDQGIDIGRYNSLELQFTYNTPYKNPKMKVSLRNFHPNYATINDYSSLKFNTIILSSDKYVGTFTVPLSAFQVESWWIEQYGIEFKDSHIDLSNVSRLEFLSYGMTSVGHYEITLKTVTLKGKLISGNDLLKLILAMWLVVGAIFLLRQHKKLNEMSQRDVLTGLYNRRGIQQKLNRIPPDNKVYMFYIDINEFKKINDTYGHDIGDKLLISFSRIVEAKIEKLKKSSYFSRFSGDEFIILFDSISQEDMLALAYAITLEFKKPISISSYNILISISLGIAKAEYAENNFDTLLAHSGAAMFHVKSNKLLSFQEFDETFSKGVYFKKRVSEFIKEALSQNEFFLNYMPIYDAKSLEIASFEVLLRTNSANMKAIGPDVFIPIAEEYNLIRAIDLWVLENTFKKIMENYEFLSEQSVVFCINMSSEELKNPLFKTDLSHLLSKYNVPPEWIELELTETSFVEIDQRGIDILNDIRSLGVKLSLDDFGTGYISFNQLVNYPVNSLKIDKSFVDLLGTENTSSETIIRAIISMATSYKLDTIAEGVETAEQYTYLSELGCHYVQGYLLSKPVSWTVAKGLLTTPQTEKLKQLLISK